MGLLKIGLFATLFLLLTAAGLSWALAHSGASLSDLRDLATLPRSSLLALAALSGLIYVADGCRYWIFARALGFRLSLLGAWEAVVANLFFSWISPAGILGAPSTIYALKKHGIPVNGGILVALGKSLSGISLLLTVALTLLVLGLVPADIGPTVRTVLAGGVAFYLAAVGVPLVGACFPGPALTALDRVRGRLEALTARTRGSLAQRACTGALVALQALRNLIERLSALVLRGRRYFIPIAICHAFYFSCFIGVIVVLAQAFGAGSWAKSSCVSIVYGAFTLLSPTPSGSGLAEATAGAFYGALLPLRSAVITVLLFRMTTFYFQILVGLVYIPLSGTWRGLLKPRTIAPVPGVEP